MNEEGQQETQQNQENNYYIVKDSPMMQVDNDMSQLH